MSAAESEFPSPVPSSRRRRVLLVSACVLLVGGLGVNAYRWASPPEAQVLSAEAPMASSGYVGYMAQPGTAPNGDDEAGGQGQRHKGEEGKMGRPTAKQRGGLYAMKGPRGVAVPQLSRNFDPNAQAREAGILGQLQQESGHFLASPYGAAFSAGKGNAFEPEPIEDAEPEPPPEPEFDPEVYQLWKAQAFTAAESDPTSTFSIDVDTGSYTLVRQALMDQESLPYSGAVRIEEMINYFDYAYPEPTGDVPFSVTTEVGPCPWDEDHRLVHIGLQGKHVAPDETPPRNLVFLVDVSGSMSASLPTVVSSLTYLTQQLNANDRISIVVYAGAVGTVLPPTPGNDKETILDSLAMLQAGGSTNGAGGIQAAYALAQASFVEGGINRVVLATDGDFNVGMTDLDDLVELIEDKRRSGVFLSVLGFGGGNYRDGVMEQLADKGNGNYAYIDRLSEARKVLAEQAGATLVTVAKDVKVQVEFESDAVSSYRLVGYDNRMLADRDFADDTKDAGEMGAGHTVTALYEIVPTDEAVAGSDLMDLRLRYKQPDGDRSLLVEVPVRDDGDGGESDDFRFSAAVAGFGIALQNAPTKTKPGSLGALRDLAAGARGQDWRCRRAELVRMIEAASALRGFPLAEIDLQCTPQKGPRPIQYAESASLSATYDPDEPFDWARFVIEVLYLLPPLLALPLFVMALRRRD